MGHGFQSSIQPRRLPERGHPRRRGRGRSASPDRDADGWRHGAAGDRPRAASQNGALADKNQLISTAIAIIDELRVSLDLKAGGPIAANLDDLYDYMCRQLVKANLNNRVETLDEVSHLLGEIRSAWIALPAEARALRPNPG